MHTSLELKIKLRPDKPVHQQITEHVRMQTALRKLQPEGRLPAIRELAKQLSVDPGTVARAYRELEREGIVGSRRGSGTYISPQVSRKYLAEQYQKRLALVLEKAIVEAYGLGFTTEDIETGFTLCLANWRERLSRARRKRTLRPRQISVIRFLGSHDLAVELLAQHFSLVYPEFHLTTTFVGSLVGLVALECREADVAGTHLRDEATGEFNIPFLKRLMPNETVMLINLVQRVQGLIVAPRNPKQVLSLADLKRPDITFINRQKGSGTRNLLDSQLLKLDIAPAGIKGFEREEKTHIGVASVIAQGRADVGLGVQSAADAAGLDFIPMLKERYDLAVLKDSLGQAPLRKLQEVVSSRSFRNMLQSIPGYDISETGTVIAVGPKLS